MIDMGVREIKFCSNLLFNLPNHSWIFWVSLISTRTIKCWYALVLLNKLRKKLFLRPGKYGHTIQTWYSFEIWFWFGSSHHPTFFRIWHFLVKYPFIFSLKLHVLSGHHVNAWFWSLFDPSFLITKLQLPKSNQAFLLIVPFWKGQFTCSQRTVWKSKECFSFLTLNPKLIKSQPPK